MVNRRFGRRRRQKCVTCNCTCVDDYDSDFDSYEEDYVAELDARRESFRKLYEHRSLDELELEMQKCHVILDKLNALPDDEIFDSKNIDFGNITRQKLYALRDIKNLRLKDKTQREPSATSDTQKKTKKKRKNKKKPTNPITKSCDSVLPSDSTDTLKGNGPPTFDVPSNLKSSQESSATSSASVTIPKEPVTKPSDGKLTRKLKVTVKGLPTDVSTNALKSALQEKGFHCVKVIQFKKRTSVSDDHTMYKDLPIFLLILPNSSHHRLIYNLNEILDFDVTIERYKGGNQQIQCYRCQGFGHAQHCCNRQPRCMKCAGLHLSFQCTKDPTSPPKCCNCGLAHPANFMGCMSRLKATISTISPMVRSRVSMLINRLVELGFDSTSIGGMLETLISSSGV